MAISIDYDTKVITVNQSDCTFVSGTFYRLPTKTVFKAEVDALMDNENYMWMDHPIDHNTEYSVAGTTYAPKIEVVNGYTVQFLPDSAWSVELTESNNNLWDIGGGVLVQNQVQVIPTNSAGLITNPKIDEIYKRLDLDGDQNYSDDGSVITNPDFTLTKNDQGDGTFDVDRT